MWPRPVCAQLEYVSAGGAEEGVGGEAEEKGPEDENFVVESVLGDANPGLLLGTSAPNCRNRVLRLVMHSDSQRVSSHHILRQF